MPPIWASYAAGSEVEHFSHFCREHLTQSVDAWEGLPLTLESFQESFLGEALAYDEKGWPVWNSVVLVLPRKNGKTTLLAAYAIYRILTSDGSPEILLAASSDKQADRLFQGCATFVRRSEALSEELRVRDYIGEIKREDGMGAIYRMSSDPARLHGYNPSLVICDELAQWTTPNLRRAYAALTSGGGARQAPQTFTITTAGEASDRPSSTLGRILDQALADPSLEESPGLKVSHLLDAKTLVYNHEAPTSDPSDIEAMKLANPASWITPEYLAKQAANPELSAAEVLQLHGCVWAAGENTWLAADLWSACKKERSVEQGTQVVLGFDGSYNNDSTGIIGCTIEEEPHLFVVGAWEKPQKAIDWVVPREEVSAAVAEAMERYEVVEFACDPPGWHREIDEWTETYGSPPVVSYQTNQRKTMSEACSKLYSAVVTKKLTHDGDERLARHMANAVVKETADGAYITKDGRNSPRKIDLAVAAVVAHDRAAFNQVSEPWLLVSA